MNATPADEAPILTCYVAVGSNVGDRMANIAFACDALEAMYPEVWDVRCSTIYETRPLGPSTGMFLNAVFRFQTQLVPGDMLVALLSIETRAGRGRTERWGPRTLDLDLLLAIPQGSMRSLQASDTRLELPHPRMLERDFVLCPLEELLEPQVLLHELPLSNWIERLLTRTVIRQYSSECARRTAPESR
jgi:2-amino-4-hydroxy-6-hydroxymethyldihydropteridine diphosphokinase